MLKYRLINGGSGKKANIYSLIKRDKEVFTEYILSLQDSDKRKFLALFKRLKEQGIFNNKQKYEIIKGTDVVELKIPGHRILVHKIETVAKYKYIILSGFKKPKKNIQQNEINKAKEKSSQIIAENAAETSRRK